VGQAAATAGFDGTVRVWRKVPHGGDDDGGDGGGYDASSGSTSDAPESWRQAFKFVVPGEPCACLAYRYAPAYAAGRYGALLDAFGAWNGSSGGLDASRGTSSSSSSSSIGLSIEDSGAAERAARRAAAVKVTAGASHERAAGFGGGIARVFHVPTTSVVRELRFHAPTATVCCVAFTPNHLVSVAADGAVHVHNVARAFQQVAAWSRPPPLAGDAPPVVDAVLAMDPQGASVAVSLTTSAGQPPPPPA